MTWNFWRLWELTLDKYLTNIWSCWELALHSISWHFKRFQLNHLPSQLTKLVNTFLQTPSPPEFFPFLRAWEIVKVWGNYLKWQILIDSFKAAIHSSATLSNIENFNYLQCFIAGDALNTVKGLSLNNDNYIKALELLQDRYGNKQAIITAHKKNLSKRRALNQIWTLLVYTDCMMTFKHK